jgi:Tfp pilus assembly protein PilO
MDTAMSHEFTRSTLARVAVVGFLAGATSFLFVKPKMSEASDLRIESESRHDYILEGESKIAQNNIKVEDLVETTTQARNAMLEDLSPDLILQDQQILQRLASARGLTVNRVEPIRESSTSAKVTQSGEKAELLEKEYRIECQGAYSAIVAFISDVQESSRQMKVTDIRLVPSGTQRVRSSLGISMVELKAYPPALDEALRARTPKREDTNEDEGSI